VPKGLNVCRREKAAGDFPNGHPPEQLLPQKIPGMAHDTELDN
jgi:hypothetical protein